jgi:hypothetical protein
MIKLGSGRELTGSFSLVSSSSSTTVSQFFLFGFGLSSAGVGIYEDADGPAPADWVSPAERREGQFTGSDFANFSSI